VLVDWLSPEKVTCVSHCVFFNQFTS